MELLSLRVAVSSRWCQEFLDQRLVRNQVGLVIELLRSWLPLRVAMLTHKAFHCPLLLLGSLRRKATVLMSMAGPRQCVAPAPLARNTVGYAMDCVSKVGNLSLQMGYQPRKCMLEPNLWWSPGSGRAFQ